MPNQVMEWTSAARQPQAETRPHSDALPIGPALRPGRRGRLVWARTIDLDHEPARQSVRNARIAGLWALVIGMLFGAEALLVDARTDVLKPYLSRVLIVNVVAAFVLTPMIVWVYLALPELTTRLLRQLRNDKVIGRSAAGSRLNEAAKELEAQFNRVLGQAAVLTVVYLVYALIDDRPKLRLAPVALLIVASSAAQGALFFLGWTTIIQLWSTSQAIGELFHTFPIHVRLQHPDGCGGLQTVGKLLSLVLFVATVLGGAGLCMVLALLGTPWAPAHRPEPYVLAGFYAVLLPSAFRHLLWRPHQLMDQRRDQILKPVARVFDAVAVANRPSAADDAPRLKAKADALWEISRQLRMLDEACPRWPLRTRWLRPVIATAVLPVAISVVTAVISKFLTG